MHPDDELTPDETPAPAAGDPTGRPWRDALRRRWRLDAEERRQSLIDLQAATGGYDWLPSDDGWLPLNLTPSAADEAPWPGDICLAFPPSSPPGEDEPVAESRYVVVRLVDHARKFASVALLSREVRKATNTDVELPPERTGIPFPLMVETDVVGPLRFNELSQPVGFVDQATLDGIVQTEITGVPEVPNARRGLVLRPGDDSRRQFKMREAEKFSLLTGPCLAELLEMPVLDAVGSSEKSEVVLDTNLTLSKRGMAVIDLRTGKESALRTAQQVSEEGRRRLDDAIARTPENRLGAAVLVPFLRVREAQASYADPMGAFSRLAAGGAERTLPLRVSDPELWGVEQLELNLASDPVNRATRAWVELGHVRGTRSLRLTLLVRLRDEVFAVALHRERAGRGKPVVYSCVLPVSMEPLVAAYPAVTLVLAGALPDAGE